LSRLNNIIKETTDLIEDYELGKACHLLYDFIWHEFADWYIEISKNEKNTELTKYIYLTLLKLLHPFIPFATEEIFSYFKTKKDQLLIINNWPEANEKLINKKAEQEFEFIQDLVNKIRNAKKENKIDPAKRIPVEIVKIDSKYFNLVQEQKENIEKIARLELKFVDQESKKNFIKITDKNIKISLSVK